MKSHTLTHLDILESESIQIMREVAAEFQRPVLLFSGGKDSICMLRIAEKAFRPARFPFPLMHIDAGHNFPELIDFRDRRAAELGEKLIVRTVEDALARGIARQTPGETRRNRLQTPTLLAAIEEFKFDCALGGARRDEEKARAKERVFSFRDAFGQWDPKNQRPELWNVYNGRINPGEHMRVFPLSNWTELDIWQYIEWENLEIPSIYFSHERPVVKRDGLWIMVDDERMRLEPGEVPETKNIRFRTLGCYPLTGAIESEASTLDEIIQEMLLTTTSERMGRTVDHESSGSLEKKKQEGHF